ncbi:MAG: hypothetical protein ACKPKO_56985 [Candidatus Fonsibacter sp.]
MSYENSKNYDLWKEFINPTTGKTDWRLRDPTQQPRYDEPARKDKEHKGSVNFLGTRLPPREYNNARAYVVSIESPSKDPHNGIHEFPILLNVSVCKINTSKCW